MRAGFVVLALATTATLAWCQVRWSPSMKEAKKAAAASGKPILIDFFAEWCGPCKMMEKDAFGDATVQSMLKNVVCVRLNVDDRPPEAQKYAVNGIPRVILLDKNASSVLMDLQGYHDAKGFLQELSAALHLKVPKPVPQESAAVTKVRMALTAGNYRDLAQKDPKTASEGLRALVAKLGVYHEEDYMPIASLIQKGGRDSIPCLLEGMGNKHLATRVASYRVLKSILDKSYPNSLKFDPWSPLQKRETQLRALRDWASSH